MQLARFSPLFSAAVGVHAAVSTYTIPVPLETPGYTYVGWEAYDHTQNLVAPPLPNPKPSMDFPVALDYSGTPQDAGIVIPGSFLGISVEMSLAEALIGPNSSWVWPQFLNLMSHLKERGGPPILRLGGNSQEKAYLVDQLDRGHSVERHVIGPSSFTNTPTLVFTKGIIEAMRVASDLIGIQWIMGIPMNQSQPARLEIVETTEPILGDFLLTWHLGNEPDLYVNHHYRDVYSEQMYVQEFTEIRDQMLQNPNIKNPNILGGPAICECGTNWTNADLITNQDYLGKFGANLNSLIVMHYPTDNCPSLQADGSWLYLTGQALIDKTQGLFNAFARHSLPDTAPNYRMTASYFANRYLPMAEIAANAQKPLILLETNTASCNGYLGLSDAFLATLWNLDLAMQLASHGFTHMFMHLGGHQAYYNPFMSPPWNSSAPFMWTVAPPFYAVLVSSEFIGSNGNTRIGDLKINNGDTYMAGYVLYENNQPVRVLLINFIDDPLGGHDYIARIQTNGATQASVRYLTAPNGLTSKFNVTYANQTFGGYFESDGLLKGQQVTETVQCTNGICPIQVPAPGAAVVFLTNDLVFNAETDEFHTFATTATTKMYNTAAVDGLTLATSNGLNAAARQKMLNAQTSNPQKNKQNSAISNTISAGIAIIGTLVTVLVAAL
ncbi:hypothetical protein BKA62DRAFT_69386 [Auriculariales sp. MPI-PUGE-AT-0066]|nr:hypothetical protein BKA62DRAFT_69386 [Auriculariales sp. MPI-PUGE-AT-0066]